VTLNILKVTVQRTAVKPTK